MMMKKYASLLFALVLALSLSVSAAADSSGVYVYDDAALLTQEEYDTLNEAAAAVSEQYGCGSERAVRLRRVRRDRRRHGGLH